MSGSNKTVKNLRKLQERHAGVIGELKDHLVKANVRVTALEASLAATVASATRFEEQERIALANLKTARVELERRSGVDRELFDARETLEEYRAAGDAWQEHRRDLEARLEAAERSNGSLKHKVERLEEDAKMTDKASRRLQHKQEQLDAAILENNQLKAELRAVTASIDIMKAAPATREKVDEAYNTVRYPHVEKCPTPECGWEVRSQNETDGPRLKEAIRSHRLLAHGDPGEGVNTPIGPADPNVDSTPASLVGA